MHAFVFWPCLSTNSTTAVAVPKSQTAQSTSSLPLPPNWSSTCLEGCLKFCHRDLRIIPQFTLTSFIRRNWTKLINNGTAEIERTSPRESTGFFFFWQCLIADERVKKKKCPRAEREQAILHTSSIRGLPHGQGQTNWQSPCCVCYGVDPLVSGELSWAMLVAEYFVLT